MYNVRVEEIPNHTEGRHQLVIDSDNEGEREYYDQGEPEDNTFWRDYAWVENELKLAYQQGLDDGREEGWQDGVYAGQESRDI